MDSTTSNLGGHPNQTTTTQQDQQPPMPSSDLTSIPGLGAIPGLGSAPPPSAPAPTTAETTNPAPPSGAPITSNEIKTEPRDEGPSVTNALEAMLSGLSPEESTGPLTADTPLQSVPTKEEPEDIKMEDTKMEDSHTLTPLAQIPEGVVATAPDDAAMMDYIPPTTTAAGDAVAEDQEGGAAEFEADSSPYESSSDSSDSSDSDDSDSDDEDAYNLLSPAEQARILMLGDGGSDDEGGGGKGGKSSGNQLRTKNEVPEEVIPKPDVVLAADTPVTELGSVTSIVDTMVLIAATTSGEFRVLESGSLLCLEDRSVIGVVAETLGRVQEPLYVVRFTSPPDIAAAGLEKGTKVYYPESHATFVFTAALKAYKGSDASNLHDEEVGDEEIEFSDDEKEMEHKRRVKAKKLEKRGILPAAGGRGGGRGGRGEHPLRKEGLSYDDDEEGPYRPLARPTGFAAAGRGEAPVEAERGYGAPGPSRGERGGRGRGGIGGEEIVDVDAVDGMDRAAMGCREIHRATHPHQQTRRKIRGRWGGGSGLTRSRVNSSQHNTFLRRTSRSSSLDSKCNRSRDSSSNSHTRMECHRSPGEVLKSQVVHFSTRRFLVRNNSNRNNYNNHRASSSSNGHHQQP